MSNANEQQGCPESPDSLGNVPYNILPSDSTINVLLRDQFANLNFPKSDDLVLQNNQPTVLNVNTHKLGYTNK